MNRFFQLLKIRFLRAFIVMVLGAAIAWADGPSPAATAGFDGYVSKLETQLAQQRRSQQSFMAMPADKSRLKSGELVIDNATPEGGMEFQGGMVHDWRGTAFVPGARAADLEKLLRDYDGYPRHYAPDVVAARVLKHDGDHYQITIRVQQKHVITVVMDTAYNVAFGRLDAQHGFSTSHSTRIDEIEDAGTPHEHALDPNDAHGFLWRLNTYWTCEERDGGLYMQIESVSLTRTVPKALGWAVGPFVESVPRESLEFTLRVTRDALKK
jgi:hypothetical protein